MVLFGAFVLIWLPCGFFAAATAEDKGHGGLAWFFGGLVFGPIALIACAGLGDRKLRRYQRFQAEAQGFKGDITTANDASSKEEPTDLYPKLK